MGLRNYVLGGGLDPGGRNTFGEVKIVHAHTCLQLLF